jgi:methionine sulfoxide reductase heme-binding subunit
MHKLLKPLIFSLALAPLGWLLFAVPTGRTSANPAEDIILTTGVWSLRFLLVTLAITPVRRLTGWQDIIRFRRMLGLFAFFYACLHVLAYVAFDRFFVMTEVVADIVERPFITAGMVAFVLMVPLAVTSTRGWIRSLGRRWQLLHRLVYVSAAAACLHFIWKVKVVVGEPVYYAIVLAILLGLRVAWHVRPFRRPARQALRA